MPSDPLHISEDDLKYVLPKGRFAPFQVTIDPTCPKNEVRFVSNGFVVGRIVNLAPPDPTTRNRPMPDLNPFRGRSSFLPGQTGFMLTPQQSKALLELDAALWRNSR